MELKPGLNIFNVELTPKPPKLEDLDFTLLKYIAESIKIFDMPRKDRILTSLESLYNALAATTAEQSYLTIIGALEYLASGVGRGALMGQSYEKTVDRFVKVGVLDSAEDYKDKLHRLHEGHYAAMRHTKVSHNQLDETKAFFKEFLMKYIEYEKVMMTHEVAK